MSSPSTEDIVRMEVERRPSVFLSLAPTTSDSYPQNPSLRTGQGALAEALNNTPVKRRTSSTSSDGTKTSGLRFLKLGPVHYGEHPGADQDDWNAALK